MRLGRPPHPTSEEAFGEAHSHDSNVREELIEVGAEEGGVGWLCLFCGAPIDESPLRLSVNWTDGDWTERGTQREQWFAAHRACLVERVSDDEAVRGGPLFEEDSHGGR
jgi:hypothetical protein